MTILTRRRTIRLLAAGALATAAPTLVEAAAPASIPCPDWWPASLTDRWPMMPQSEQEEYLSDPKMKEALLILVGLQPAELQFAIGWMKEWLTDLQDQPQPRRS